MENKNSKRKYGCAMGNGSKTSGRYHRVHLRNIVAVVNKLYSEGKNIDHIFDRERIEEVLKGIDRSGNYAALPSPRQSLP